MMFGFIKKLLPNKTFKEDKQEYKQTKANYMAKIEELENKENVLKANEIITHICNLCCSALRPDQEDCPTLIIYNYKKLLEFADDGSLVTAHNLLCIYLSEKQHQDFMNKISQLKEYKEWLMRKKLNEIKGDFE